MRGVPAPPSHPLAPTALASPRASGPGRGAGGTWAGSLWGWGTQLSPARDTGTPAVASLLSPPLRRPRRTGRGRVEQGERTKLLQRVWSFQLGDVWPLGYFLLLLLLIPPLRHTPPCPHLAPSILHTHTHTHYLSGGAGWESRGWERSLKSLPNFVLSSRASALCPSPPPTAEECSGVWEGCPPTPTSREEGEEAASSCLCLRP